MLSGKQKAVAAFILTTLGGIVTWALAEFPDNNDVQTWGAIIAGIVTVLVTTAGVYQVTNTPAVVPPAEPVAPV